MRVGVEVNTASKELLAYVSGLDARRRGEHRPLSQRARTVRASPRPARGAPARARKAFEQSAGFLRIRDGAQPLDASAVHPESYPIVDRMAPTSAASVSDLLRDAALRQRIEPQRYVSERPACRRSRTSWPSWPSPAAIHAPPTRPSTSPRASTRSPTFEPGMTLPGIVTNVTAFGAFVDIGVHQDGLVHISQLADRFVKDPNEVVKVQQHVQVTVVDVDVARKRIALSMRKRPT